MVLIRFGRLGGKVSFLKWVLESFIIESDSMYNSYVSEATSHRIRRSLGHIYWAINYPHL